MIVEPLRQNLRAIVSAYRGATGVSLSQVSKDFYGNASFMKDFLAGRGSVSVDKLDEMLRKFAHSWPVGAKWPLCRAIILPAPRRSMNGRRRRRENNPQAAA